jgi:hypothetical protein
MTTIDSSDPVAADGSVHGVPNGTDRRLVLKTSLATLAALGTGTLSGLARAQDITDPATLTDDDILNFALNLEYLEANYYLIGTTGSGLSGNDTGGKGKEGTVTGGSMVNFTNTAVKEYMTEIASDELSHVLFLRAALGSKTVAQPAINLQQSFNTLAMAAGLGNTFNPFASETDFILGAFIFEDVGVTAYHGAATSITNKDYLDAAAGILAVEAYHAGLVRTLCYQDKLGHDADKISKLRNMLSAEIGPPKITDQGVILKGQANIIPADKNAIAFERTPYEVLNIVYAGGKSGDFGFFPDRVNGKIH